ncbi:MAG: FlgD immunoglobulin-like domain containing protein, partial [Mariniphaga sp.]|nr:FlgD immunoglobulin-like domain containing protein [Mariniphaga sp.]
YKNRVLANPPGFDRKHSENEVTVPKVHFTESKDLYLAAVLPHKVPTDGQSILICNSWNSGELMIDLVTTAGEKVANLFKGDIRQGLFMMKWDGKDPDGKKQYSGDYYIRYTINGGYRETPVVI